MASVRLDAVQIVAPSYVVWQSVSDRPICSDPWLAERLAGVHLQMHNTMCTWHMP